MEERNAVAWFCAYTPLEILDAAGLSPSRRFGDPESLESADTLLHPAICPYVRACLAGEMDAGGPHHAVFVNSCDGMRRLYDAWRARYPEHFVFLLDLPRKGGKWGERILAAEYLRLAQAVEDFWDRSIGPQALREAGERREERRRAYLRAAEGMSGGERLRLAMELQARPLDEAVPPDPGGGSGGVPVILTGNLLNPAGLVSVLDRAGAGVSWVDLCNGDRAFSYPTLPAGCDVEEQCSSLARAYLERWPCSRMADARRRHDLLVEKARESGARGVIYASLKFCDAYIYDFPRVQQRLREEGIPLLRLESDYADGHLGQLLTRVEAFLEML